MTTLTIDGEARFVSIQSFNLGLSDLSTMSLEVQRTVEQRLPRRKGFIGCIVMVNREEPRLLVVSVWQSAQAWSAAQYDQEIGRVVTDVVETARSYEIQTYETVAIVR